MAWTKINDFRFDTDQLSAYEPKTTGVDPIINYTITMQFNSGGGMVLSFIDQASYDAAIIQLDAIYFP